MKTLPVGELKAQFSEVLEKVKLGESFGILYGKKKKPIAIIASTNNNFSDSLIKIGSVPRSWIPTIDISSNYFGYYTTQEMYTIGARKNVTNIYDYFDDITLPELLYHPSPLYPLVDIGCNLE